MPSTPPEASLHVQFPLLLHGLLVAAANLRIRDGHKRVSQPDDALDVLVAAVPVGACLQELVVAVVVRHRAAQLEAVLQADVVHVCALEDGVAVSALGGAIGPLGHHNGECEEVAVFFEEERFVVREQGTVGATVADHGDGHLFRILDVTHIEECHLESLDGGVVDRVAAVDFIGVDRRVGVFAKTDHVRGIVWVQIIAEARDFQIAEHARRFGRTEIDHEERIDRLERDHVRAVAHEARRVDGFARRDVCY